MAAQPGNYLVRTVEREVQHKRCEFPHSNRRSTIAASGFAEATRNLLGIFEKDCIYSIFLYHGEDYFRPPTEFANFELPMTTGYVLVLRAANPMTAGMFRPTITGLQETSVPLLKVRCHL